jgi:hypothetical protein
VAIFTFNETGRDLRLDAVGERLIWPLIQATNVRVQCHVGDSWGTGRVKVRASIDGINFVDIEELSMDGVSAEVDFQSYVWLAVECTAASASALVASVSVCAKGIISI